MVLHVFHVLESPLNIVLVSEIIMLMDENY